MVQVYAYDWSHLEENACVYTQVDGKDGKFLTKLPSPEVMAKKKSIIVTENMPAKQAKPYIDAGIPVLRCSGNATAKLREQVQEKKPEWEKTHKDDTKLIWMLYKKKPDAFRQMKLDPPLAVYYAIFKDYQKVRNATSNRLFSDMSEVMKDFLKMVEKGEDELKRVVAKELPKHPIWEQWLSTFKGMGPALGGGLIALIGDISKYDTISKLWAYSGYAVIDGKAQKRKAGVASNWKNKIRTHCYNVVDQFIKQRTPVYRDIYDNEKARQLKNGLPLYHAHNRAIRKTAKIFLQHYWLVARQIAGLPISQPWVIAHGGHVDYIPPPNWNGPKKVESVNQGVLPFGLGPDGQYAQ